ncbi:unnamed protein product [Zymoseptoria tritici ST99CH_3D7]|uniref:Uncharacterized protein n=1 Tax=Zymoseptoria tritici (strain ST99CH_3D7) TaxID=1276538 RepID=A0A1X7RXC4_ZYMT9|nr:unnamed protein product [Zymoseptoria tritici ST99CH_3D7]
MATSSFPASFVRSGTSNGLLIHRHHLPTDIKDWQPILSAAMGSPDPYGRQLDGIGSGISSTSKICIVAKSDREDVDLDYTFVQVGIRDGDLDMAGNCGNMSAIVAPWAADEGMLQHIVQYEVEGENEGKRVTVKIFNTNTSKVVHVTFDISSDGVYDPVGDYSIDGVPGTGSRITLQFRDPGGAKTGRVLPTGNAVDTLVLPDGETIQASLVDVANPGIFVRAEDVGIPGNIKPAMLEERVDVMERLELIRREGTRMMGLDPDVQSVPKIVLVSKPTPEAVADGTHVVCRALSMQQPHKAVPLTLALNLGAACRIPGTIPALTAVNTAGKESIVVAHASGKVEVGSVFENGKIISALLNRTARIMMKGDVFYPDQNMKAANSGPPTPHQL